MKDIATFLMFSGRHHAQAQEAVNFYVSLFPGSSLDSLVLYGAGEDGTEGTVRTAVFTLKGRKFMAFDSIVDHAFNFTPSISLFVECDTLQELERFYNALVAGGEALMPLDNYGFSQRFGWVNDRFGISWQLNLAG